MHPFLATLRRAASKARQTRAWRPQVLTLLGGGMLYRRRNEIEGHSDDDHLRAAARWLAGAQDASADGGVAGRYRLGTGWTSSYPETTGYIIPTFLALAQEAGMAEFRDRAARCVEFLLGVQLPDGAFPGLEIADNRDEPSVFNTAQILNGLTQWHAATGDERTLRSAHRAAAWLVGVQDADGAWRRHVYGDTTYTYMAHAGCWLAELGVHTGEQAYLDAARRHLDWVLAHVDAETGWIEECGFGDDAGARRSVTHTLAYTIFGILRMAKHLGHDRGLAVARRAARAVARRLELSRRLPGKLDWRWRPAARYACLTGNAQMALIWMELHELDGDPSLLSAACKALDLVKRAQPMSHPNAGVRGGIAGSDPLWGDYIELAFPNWAAKFFIDAMLEKRRAIASLDVPVASASADASMPDAVPTGLPPVPAPAATPVPRVVLFALDQSPKVEQFMESWASWGFVPSAVVVPRTVSPSRLARLGAHVESLGFRSLARRALGLPSMAPAVVNRQGTIATSGMSVSDYCGSRGIRVVHVQTLDAPGDVAALRALDADVFVYAGCGIMRAATLAVPRLGTLNAHMGLLPPMRGMNVAEWSIMGGVPVGCTIHLIDPGIDTGDVLLFRPVDITGAEHVDAMRHRVDRAQIQALGEVLHWTLQAGALPPRRAQRPDEGRQYFSMHDDVRDVLQQALRRRL